MTGRVEKDPEELTRLLGRLPSTDFEDRRLGSVEVINDDVDVHLLRVGLTGPAGSVVILDLLNADRRPRIGGDLGPGPVIVDGDLPIEELSVEFRELARVGSIDHDNRLLCNSHVCESTPPGYGFEECANRARLTR